MLSLIPKRGKITTDKLLAKYYGEDGPFYGRQALIGMINSLVRKSRAKGLKLDYRVFRSERAGPNPIQVWVEKA